MTSDGDRRERAEQGHRLRFATAAEVVAFAPGRVNLIGEHTDYNGGLVLPIALAEGTTCAVSRRTDHELHVFSCQSPAVVHRLRPSDFAGVVGGGWTSYVAGCHAVAAEKGWIDGGLDVWVDGDVPLGAGLSSSASLECSVLMAIRGLTEDPGSEGDRLQVATAAQSAEHRYAGVPCGIMDQAASMLGRRGQALLLDSGRLTVAYVPLHLDAMGLSILLVDTNARHQLTDGRYAARRADCERAARRLGLDHLASLAPDERGRVDSLPEPDRRRARHVVTENARVSAAANAFGSMDLETLGQLFAESHASLSGDFEVSCPELDVAVAAAVSAGAVASRMTGGGFGGSTVNLVRAGDEARVRDVIQVAFSERRFAPPSFLSATPSDGARVIRATEHAPDPSATAHSSGGS